MMDVVKNKINLISKILKTIESENEFTNCLWKLSGNNKRNTEQYDTEYVYWDLIKPIIDQDEIPNNVCAITINVDDTFEVSGYEMISSSVGKIDSDIVFNVQYE